MEVASDSFTIFFTNFNGALFSSAQYFYFIMAPFILGRGKSHFFLHFCRLKIKEKKSIGKNRDQKCRILKDNRRPIFFHSFCFICFCFFIWPPINAPALLTFGFLFLFRFSVCLFFFSRGRGSGKLKSEAIGEPKRSGGRIINGAAKNEKKIAKEKGNRRK